MQFRAGKVTVCRNNFPPNGKPCHNRRCRAREMLFCRLNCQHNLVRLFCERFIGHTGVCILLMNRCFYTHFCRRAHHRSADITAEADCDIGCKIRQNLFHCARRFQKQSHGFYVFHDILRRRLSLKACNFNCLKRKTRRRHQTGFHMVCRTDKQNFCFGVAPTKLARHSKCIDMPAGSARRKYDFHKLRPLFQFFSTLEYRETDSTTPISNNSIIKDVPP